MPDGGLQVLLRDAELGEALVTHPGVGMVSFTGSTEVGRRMVSLSAAELKPVMLELGGKSANIIFADAAHGTAAEHAVGSAFANARQDCCSRTRCLIEASVYDETVDAIRARIKSQVVGHPFDPATTVGPRCRRRSATRVVSMIEAGIRQGGQALAGGKAVDGPGWFVEPTLLDRCRVDSEIAQQEIFGPVLVVLPFVDEADAVPRPTRPPTASRARSGRPTPGGHNGSAAASRAG